MTAPIPSNVLRHVAAARRFEVVALSSSSMHLRRRDVSRSVTFATDLGSILVERHDIRRMSGGTGVDVVTTVEHSITVADRTPLAVADAFAALLDRMDP